MISVYLFRDYREICFLYCSISITLLNLISHCHAKKTRQKDDIECRNCFATIDTNESDEDFVLYVTAIC
jgi:hypothetical protein